MRSCRLRLKRHSTAKNFIPSLVAHLAVFAKRTIILVRYWLVESSREPAELVNAKYAVGCEAEVFEKHKAHQDDNKSIVERASKVLHIWTASRAVRDLFEEGQTDQGSHSAQGMCPSNPS